MLTLILWAVEVGALDATRAFRYTCIFARLRLVEERMVLLLFPAVALTAGGLLSATLMILRNERAGLPV